MRLPGIRSLFAAVVLAILPLCSAAALTNSNIDMSFKIDREPLGKALQEFAVQSGIQVIYLAKITDGLYAPPLHGRFTPEQALAKILGGSKLTYREVNPHTIEVMTLAAAGSFSKSTDTRSAQRVASATAGVGSLPLAPAAADGPSVAQSDESDTSNTAALSPVTVTARRFAENLQSTPVAVSAFTNTIMRQLAIEDATDLSGRAPNVQIMQTGAGSGAVSIFIRGTGNTALGFNLENPVGMYVDDVYLPRLQGSLIDALEFDRIEVLRGPQGTLYGRDSTVGAIKYISKQPDLYDASYDGDVTLGDFDRRDVRVSASVPIVPGELAVSVDAATRNEVGYMEGVNSAGVPTGQFGNGLDRQSARTQILWTPDEHWKINLEADVADDKSGSTQATPLVSESGGPCVSEVAPCRTLFSSPYLTGINTSDNPGFDDTAGTSAHVEYDAPWGTVKSITAYRNLQELDAIDLSQVPDTSRILPDTKNQEQVSQELQLHSKPGRLSWLFGLFYFREHIAHYADFLGLQLNDDHQTSNSYAGFADITYALLDNLHLDVGGRFTDEDRSIYRAVLPVTSGPAIIAGSAGFSETKPTYKVGLDYEITPDLMAYVSNATGYRPGSFSSTYAFPAVAPVVFGHTNSETAVSTEIGIKSQWLENRLRANLDVFHTEYQNAQTQATSFPYNVTATNFNYKGVELELDARPIPELTFYGSLGVLSADTESGPDAGLRPHFAPPIEYSLGAEYRKDVGHQVTLFAGINDVYTAQFTTDPSNIPSVTQSAYYLLGAQLGAEFQGGKYQITLDGKNLTNSAYFLATSPNAVQFYGPPRTVFVTLSAHL